MALIIKRGTVASFLFIVFIAIPRVLNGLGRELGEFAFMLEAWWIFVIALIALCVVAYPWLRNWRVSAIVLVGAVFIAWAVAVTW